MSPNTLASEAWCGRPARGQGGVSPPQELARRGCVRTSPFNPLPNPRYLRGQSSAISYRCRLLGERRPADSQAAGPAPACPWIRPPSSS